MDQNNDGAQAPVKKPKIDPATGQPMVDEQGNPVYEEEVEVTEEVTETPSETPAS